MTPQHTLVNGDTAPRLIARLVWAEGGWRCLVTPRSVLLYSGGKRLLTHTVRDTDEWDSIADIWLRSIRRMADLTSDSALLSKG